MANKKILGSERIRLDIHIGIRNVIDEWWFTNIRIACHYQSPLVCVNLR